MRTLFTPHAGEVLVGAEIARRIKGAEVWLPAKDQGIDLLITNSDRTRAVGLQVKFSRDFSQGGDLVAGGWWKFDRQKIRISRADLWVFVLVPLDRRKTWYVLIPPDELERRISEIHGKVSPVHLYLNVTKHLARPRTEAFAMMCAMAAPEPLSPIARPSHPLRGRNTGGLWSGVRPPAPRNTPSPAEEYGAVRIRSRRSGRFLRHDFEILGRSGQEGIGQDNRSGSFI